MAFLNIIFMEFTLKQWTCLTYDLFCPSYNICIKNARVYIWSFVLSCLCPIRLKFVLSQQQPISLGQHKLAQTGGNWNLGPERERDVVCWSLLFHDDVFPPASQGPNGRWLSLVGGYMQQQASSFFLLFCHPKVASEWDIFYRRVAWPRFSPTLGNV